MRHHIILHGRVPSKKNSKRMIQRGSRRFLVPSENHEMWHEEQILSLRNMWPKNLIITHAKEIIMEFWFPDNRKADSPNKAESILDLLVDAGILKDDSWQILPVVTLWARGIDEDNPRVEITIENNEH